MKKEFLYILLSIILLSNCQTNNKETNYETPFIQEVSEAIYKSPQDAALYAQRGLAYSDLELYEKGMPDLEKSLQLAPENPNIYNWLSDVYYDVGEIEKSLSLIENAIERFPKQENLYLKGAELALIEELPQRAAIILSTYKMRYGTSLDSDYLYGRILLQEKDTVQAITLFERILADANEVPLEVYYEIGKIQKAQNNFPAKLVEVLKADSTDVEVHFLMAEYYSDHNQLKKAEDHYRKILLLEHNNTDALYNMGLLNLEHNELEKAIVNFRLTTKLDPSYVKAYYFLGIAFEKQGKIGDAKKAYNHLLKIDPNFSEARKALDQISN